MRIHSTLRKTGTHHFDRIRAETADQPTCTIAMNIEWDRSKPEDGGAGDHGEQFLLTDAELEDDDDGEDGPDGVAVELLERAFDEYEEGDDGERQAHLGPEHHLPAVGSPKLPRAHRELRQPPPSAANPAARSPDKAAVSPVVGVEPERAPFRASLLRRQQQPLLAPLREGFPERSQLGRRRHLRRAAPHHPLSSLSVLSPLVVSRSLCIAVDEIVRLSLTSDAPPQKSCRGMALSN